MSIEAVLIQRSGQQCELCKSTVGAALYEVEKSAGREADTCIHICQKCISQIEKKEELDPSHWQCLTEAMWSEIPGVQVTAWRMLNRLRQESWAAESLDMIYMDEDRMAWAKATGDHENDATVDLHRDTYGQVLQMGDTVVLTQSLDVKGSTVNARVGTVVRNIRLVPGNTDQIEGKIEGQTIVILTKYLRKQGN